MAGGKGMDLIEVIQKGGLYIHKVTLEQSQRHHGDSHHRQVLHGNCRHFFFSLYLPIFAFLVLSYLTHAFLSRS